MMRNIIQFSENIKEIEVHRREDNLIGITYKIGLLGIEDTNNMSIEIIEKDDEKILKVSATSMNGNIVYKDVMVQLREPTNIIDFSSCKYNLCAGILYINFSSYYHDRSTNIIHKIL